MSGVAAVSIGCSCNVNRKSVEQVEEKIMESVKLVGEMLAKLSDEKFKKARSSYVRLLNRPSTNFRENVMKNSLKIIDRNFNFNKNAEMAQHLAEITRTDFLQYFKGDEIVNSLKTAFDFRLYYRFLDYIIDNTQKKLLLATEGGQPLSGRDPQGGIRVS